VGQATKRSGDYNCPSLSHEWNRWAYSVRITGANSCDNGPRSHQLSRANEPLRRTTAFVQKNLDGFARQLLHHPQRLGHMARGSKRRIEYEPDDSLGVDRISSSSR
jgi:hypothetical protein